MSRLNTSLSVGWWSDRHPRPSQRTKEERHRLQTANPRKVMSRLNTSLSQNPPITFSLVQSSQSSSLSGPNFPQPQQDQNMSILLSCTADYFTVGLSAELFFFSLL